MKFYEKQNYRDGEEMSVCQGLKVGEELTTKDLKNGDGTILHLDCGGDQELFICQKPWN